MPVPDWRAAIRTAGGLLVDTGATTTAYTIEMIDNVVENGPYLGIASGFVLAHARPLPAVLRTVLSWVPPTRPVARPHHPVFGPVPPPRLRPGPTTPSSAGAHTLFSPAMHHLTCLSLRAKVDIWPQGTSPTSWLTYWPESNG